MTERKQMPLIPLRGLTVFPNMIIHFDVGRDKSVKAIEAAMLHDEELLLVTQKDTKLEEPEHEDLYEIGTIVKVKQIVKLKPPVLKVLVEGIKRAKLLEVTSKEYMEGYIEEIEEEELEVTLETEALMRTVGELFESYASLNTKLSMDMVYSILGGNSPVEVIDLIIANMPLEVAKKQAVLECLDITKRIYKVVELLQEEVELLKIQKQIYNKVKDNIDQTQKEYYLREQLKVIQEELGDKDGLKADVDSYKQKLNEHQMPEEVKAKIEREINRLMKIPSSSPETSMLRTYIEAVLDLPWEKSTEEIDDLKVAEDTLERDHYGLTQVKDRILDFLAVKNFSRSIEAPILCLVGPPGVGKTSIAKSIAEATGRNYVRISLGGVRDEAEIRGHRRTYVGAMPGRFATALTQAHSNNPLMLLDEIDKMMGDFRGDPAAALLEILDGAQNHSFRDHYLEVPIDLSKVLFVATANSLSTIPRPLLDRMEIIEVSSYTSLEKLQIAERYLVPKELKKHGLTKKTLKISEEALKYVIEHYTREAGVRNLERQIGTLCRKATREMTTESKKSVTINSKKVQNYLGAPKVNYAEKNKKPQVGVVRGLAWTAVGGDTLSIEVNVMDGKGSFELTGNMGNVMKESAKAAMSFIRSKREKLELKENFYQNIDIHIHIPEGAVPKDGPSAGITMATAIISALTNKPVRNDIAMTGEVTIRGRVLPIGGLKEKILAAKRAGIFEVIVPKENEKNIREIDADVLDGVKVIYAETMEDVLEHVFA
ncbi:endopeptidase La [Niameybacter massiliensis]|uniref:Lon protease n=1 Tax=Holtiella tumoricola TaxID=3018743 RepID=A0AA42IZI2_9FIRM|nr:MULTISPECIES: endopeptidase La [Lachnospirales]MDA3730203.1 endopeptidase La [Holtiella tumoricola]